MNVIVLRKEMKAVKLGKFFSSVFGGKDYNFAGSYKAVDVAKYIVGKCSKESSPISNLQLQKILYYTQKEFLQKHRRALFADNIEAWPFGPVINEVYYYFCGFGSFPISYVPSEETAISPEDLSIIDKITEEKRVLNPWAMVDDTHAKGKAWDLIYRDGFGYKEIIPKELIVSHG